MPATIMATIPAFSSPLHVGRPNIGNRQAFLQRVGQILDNCWLTNNGEMVRELETRIAARLGVKHCVAIANGTLALEIAIRALGLSGEVIVPSWTFISTAHALHWQGITPVFADIDPATHNLSPSAVRDMITPRTTGIIGVHLWGRPAPVKALQAIADEHGLKLLFDAAHAFGNLHQGRCIGNFGACEIFSFHATKAFNTMEGGAIVTHDDELAEKARLMRNFGFQGNDNVIYPGINGKMTEIHAAFGLTNLESLDDIFTTNRRNYRAYAEALANVPGVKLLGYNEEESRNYQHVVLEVQEDSPVSRDELIAALHRNNVLARRYFWPGAHAMQPYRDLFPHASRALPETLRVAKKSIVLPNSMRIDATAIEKIVNVILGRLR
jgi:dTDP-4-amino-4,6-dideoxygalactose transaminase